MTYFKDKPHRTFYAVFFVLIYLSALLQTVTPLGPSRMPAYVPEKVKINTGGSLKGHVEGYFGENFFHRRNSEEVWMTNHGLVLLENVSPTGLKIDLSFQVLSDRKRVLRISANERVLERARLAKGWHGVKIRRLMLEPGELLLYLYSPEGTQKIERAQLDSDRELSVAVKDFELELVDDYTFRERVRIVQQRIFNFINHINYLYTSVVAFLFLLVAFVLHAYSALRGEHRA